uniref:Uncharacterized protein n=1 Tax=Attheya septentrionalis TaxID=420275 RepID=A0A7S2XPD4_9STRA|mmetsp:Transcript_18082/g.32787  ORF Transcript_18082/g.32787 Transcript_18082/m.32787 type:complete len:193 (+) Transcript_18082:71-649(+)
MESVRLHILTLHESPVLDGNNYDRFRMQWILMDYDGGQQQHPIMGEDIPQNNWTGIGPGDVILFPELLSGAGEFEGTRMASIDRIEGAVTGRILLPCGIEYPEFPQPIIAAATTASLNTLRTKYEPAFEAVLSCGGFTMKDILGGDDETVLEFWSSPPVVHPKTYDEQWIIPLSQCTLIQTISFPSTNTTDS